MKKWNFYRTEEPEMSLEINFEGYFANGKFYGPPENCYPDEGEDNRQIASLTIFGETLTGEGLDKFLNENPGFEKMAKKWVEKLDFPEDMD